MKFARLGTSDVKVTPLSFGAWAIGGWMWGGYDKEKAVRAIEALKGEKLSVKPSQRYYSQERN